MSSFEKAFVGVILLLVLSVTGCTGHNYYLIGKSADPLATACAIGASSKACLIVAGRK